jgi:regulator of nucleoside diphosphate kinase
LLEEAMNTLPRLILTTRDARRLEALLASPRGRAAATAAQLEAEIVRAEVREPASVPADVVTMNSELLCRLDGSNEERRLRLVYPDDAAAGSEHVSVLAPVGAALLGLSEGQSIDWPLPGGRLTRLTVTRVVFQPEAAGQQD